MKRLLLLSLILVATGCQTAHFFEKEVVVDNATFMSLWRVYRHCQSSQDLDAMLADLHHLAQTVQRTPSVKDLAPVPKPIERFVSDPVNRLAVDLNAMTAACMLYTGQVALNTGRTDLAAELFQTLITNYAQPEYRYYVTQARVGMEQVEFRYQVVREAPPSPSPLLARSPSQVQAYR